MRRFWLVLTLIWIPALVAAQEDGLRRDGARPLEAAPTETEEEVAQDPILRVQFDESETIPGQPLSLRMTVLVPTSLIDPPVWPSLEAPNLLVRLPERSTGPVSETIGGETWSGVSRHYRISPMVPGAFEIPPQEVSLRWQGPDGPTETVLRTQAISFAGVLPEGAEGLDPFVAARSLTLSRDLQGEPEGMTPGDSVTLTVTASIEGVSPMFLPPLLPEISVPGVANYPDEPVVSERDDRGIPGGTRVERTTLVAEGGGQGQVPQIELAWYNIERKTVETAMLPALDLLVDGPPVATTEPRDWRQIALIAVALGLLIGGLAGLAWRLWPVLRRWQRARRVWYLGSERYAWSQLQKVLAERDAPELYKALDLWAERCADDPRAHKELRMALLLIGASRHRQPAESIDAAWKALDQALRAVRHSLGHRDDRSHALPPLNPTGRAH